MQAVLAPLARAIEQLDDPAFLAVLWRSLAWAVAAFVLLLLGAVWAVHNLLVLHGLWAWAADLLSGVGAGLLAFWLYLPVATAIGMLFLDRIAGAVERRFYPFLPPPEGAPVAWQVWDGVAVALRVLLLNLLALPLVLLIPGIGAVLAWAVAAWAIGRGLFVGVAMRRMARAEAERAYRRLRPAVLAQGALLALVSYLPFLNLLLPLLGVATMVHVLDRLGAPGGGLFAGRRA